MDNYKGLVGKVIKVLWQEPDNNIGFRKRQDNHNVECVAEGLLKQVFPNDIVLGDNTSIRRDMIVSIQDAEKQITRLWENDRRGSGEASGCYKKFYYAERENT